MPAWAVWGYDDANLCRVGVRCIDVADRKPVGVLVTLLLERSAEDANDVRHAEAADG